LRVDCSSRTSRIVRDGDFCSESDETMRNLHTQTTSDVEAVDPLVEARLVECAIGGPSAIKARLSELDREWGCNRVLEVLIASTSLIGLAIAAFVSPWGMLATAVASLLLLENALTRRSILNPVLKRFGWRSGIEREQERAMLKAIRGDFNELPSAVEEEDRVAIARLEAEGGMVDGPEIPVPLNHAAIREVIEIVQRDSPA
jgi:hypothetical protein